jgi:hypothetical protein
VVQTEALARAAQAAPFLQIQHIVKKFDDVFAVDDVSLDFCLAGLLGLRQIHLAAYAGRL